MSTSVPDTRQTWPTNELEHVGCDLCGLNDAKPIFIRPDGLTVVQCLGCGLCFLNPRPSAALISRLYGSSYFTKHSNTSEQLDIGYANRFSSTARLVSVRSARARLNVISDFIHLQGTSCLEVGCASGEFCHLLRRSGAKPYGTDISLEAIKQAQSRYLQIPFENVELESVRARDLPLICAFEVIEHVLSPRAFLQLMSDRLAPGGLVALTTPNLDCGKHVGYENWLGFHMSFEHLHFLSPQVLGKYAARTGLQLVEWFTDHDSGDRVTPKPIYANRFVKPARRLMTTIGLLEAYRFLRIALFGETQVYEPKGQGHNLLVLLRKAATHPKG